MKSLIPNFVLIVCFLFVVICDIGCVKKNQTSEPDVVSLQEKKQWHKGQSVIDSHVHIFPTMVGLAQARQVFKKSGIDKFVIKSAGYVGSAKYEASLAMMDIVGDDMRAFSNINWRQVNRPGFIADQVKLLEQAKKDGIVGIKIFKALGLSVLNEDGSLLEVDDPKLGPIFESCGRLELIVAWHVADPVAFFEPVTEENERYEELSIAESWSFYGDHFPSHDELIEARDRVIEKYPETIFLLIHLANYPEDLNYVDRLLDRFDNVYVDVSARVPEIGRHSPELVQAFFIKHQDRILFGSDFISGADGSMQLGSVSETKPDLAAAVLFYERHWQYFETADQEIEHPTPIQGAWKINAIDLPDEVLKKFYFTNGESLIFKGKSK